MSGGVRVAYVLKMFPRTSETFVINEILELERRGIPLVIYSLKSPQSGPRHGMLAHLQADVVYLPETLWRALPVTLSAHARLLARGRIRYLKTLLYILTRRNWSAWKRFFQSGVMVLDAERRGIRHFHAHFASSATRVAMLASRLSPGLGYSFTAHAKDIYLDRQDVDLLRDKIAEARFVVTVSDYNLRHLESLCGPEVMGRVARLYNGVRLEQFSDERKSPPGRRILCVARLVEKKGVAVLLKSLALVKRSGAAFSCHIVGDGPLRAHLEALRRDLELEPEVIFLGAISHEEVAAEMRQAALFALPCVVAPDGNRDGLPTVILEAMAARLPVISTRVTGIPEMIDHETSGLIVEPDQPEQLADALIRLLSDPTTAARMGGAGRCIVEERFKLQRNVSELHDKFLAVLDLSAAESLRDPTLAAPVEARNALP